MENNKEKVKGHIEVALQYSKEGDNAYNTAMKSGFFQKKIGIKSAKCFYELALGSVERALGVMDDSFCEQTKTELRAMRDDLKNSIAAL